MDLSIDDLDDLNDQMALFPWTYYVLRARMVKPLNVLVMTDSKPIYEAVQTKLEEVINPSKHLVYRLDPTSSFHPSPADTALLVVPKPDCPDKFKRIFPFVMAYIRQNGSKTVVEEDKLHLSGFRQQLRVKGQEFFDMHCNLTYPSEVVNVNTKIDQLTASEWRQILRCLDVSAKAEGGEETHGFARLYTKEDCAPFKSGQTVKRKVFDLKFVSDESEAEPVSGTFPIIVGSGSGDQPSFDFDSYAKLLETRHIGRTVIHAPVVGSSFDLIEGEPFKKS